MRDGRRTSRLFTTAGYQLAVFALVVAPLLAATGCATESAWEGSVEVRDGTTFVSNPEAPLWQDDPGEPARITFELEQVFGADADPVEAILGQPFSLYAAVDTDGNVYVLDGQSHKLVRFAADGSVVWAVGREGEGPAEFDNAAGVAVRGDGTVVVTNRNRTRIDRWDVSGNYVSGFALTGPPVSLPSNGFPFLGGFAADDALVLYSPIWGKVGSSVSVIDIDRPEVTAGFEWDALPDLEMPSAVASEVAMHGDRGLIVAGSSAGYQFRLYSTAGEVLMHATRAVEYPVRAGFFEDDGVRGVFGFGEVRPPMHLDPDYLLVGVTWTIGVDDPNAFALDSFRDRRERANSGEAPAPPPPSLSSFDLFDREGRLLYSLLEDTGNWPSTGRPLFIGPDNRLYTLADDPFPQIRRYRVIVRP